MLLHQYFKPSQLQYVKRPISICEMNSRPKIRLRTKKSSTASADKSEEISGRTSSLAMSAGGGSNGMSNKRNRKTSNSRPNCTGPGSIKDYASYVKSGGFVPLPVLEPERGVESALFAQYPGLDDKCIIYFIAKT